MSANGESVVLDLLNEIKRQGEKAISSSRRLSFFQLLFLVGPVVIGLCYYFFIANTNWMRVGPLSDAIGVVRINGEINSKSLASADRVIPALKKAFENDKIKKVILSIDSPGGSPVEAERIYTMMNSLRKEYDKPVVAVINNIGASAAYMIAMHADEVVAANYSLVGSIGAIMTSLQFEGAAERLGISQRVYASGHLKDFLNPFTLPTSDVDRKAHQLVSEIGATFVKDLHEARKGRLKDGVEYGTGEPWSAAEAFTIGLIDRIGTIEEEMQLNGQRYDSYDVGPYPPASLGLTSLLQTELQSAVKQVLSDSSVILR